MYKFKIMIILLMLGVSIVLVPAVMASNVAILPGVISKSTMIQDSKWSFLKKDTSVLVIDRVLQDPNAIGPGWFWSYSGVPGEVYNPMTRYSIAKYGGYRT